MPEARRTRPRERVRVKARRKASREMAKRWGFGGGREEVLER
jgi:hypothetical protein